MGNILNFMLGVKLVSMIVNHHYIHNQSNTIYMENKEKLSNFKDKIETKIKTFFEELKETKFNRDECLQHFPGCFHFEGISERRSRVETLDSPENYSRGNFLENDDPTFNKKSYLFNITDEVTIEEEPNVFPEFSIVFLIV